MMRHRFRLAIGTAALGGAIALTGCAGASDGGSGDVSTAGSIEGTYRYTLEPVDGESLPGEFSDPADLASFPWVHTITLDDGVYRLAWRTRSESGTTKDGTYSVDDDTLVIDGFDDKGFPAHLELIFEVTPDGLVLTPGRGMSEGDAYVFTARPWERID